MVLSPLFGGVIYDADGKYAVFAGTMALIGLDMLFRLCMIVEPRQATSKTMIRLDTSESKITNSPTPSLCSNNGETPKLPSTRSSGILRLVRSPRLLAALYGIFLKNVLIHPLQPFFPFSSTKCSVEILSAPVSYS